MAQQAKSVDGTYKKLNELVRQPKERVAFELQRLKQEAKKQIPVDAAEAHTLLGAIACLERNLDKVREHHRIAAQLLPSEPMVFSNFAHSLANLGQFAEAAEQSEIAAKLQPENLSYLKSAIRNNFFGGNIKTALDLCDDLNVRAPEHEWGIEAYLKSSFAPTFYDLSLTDAAVRVCLNACTELLRERRLMPAEVQWCIDKSDTEEASLTYEVKVDAPVHELVSMNLEVQERILSRESDDSNDSVCVLFRYAELDLAETFANREDAAA